MPSRAWRLSLSIVRPGFFYGWILVAVLLVVNSIGAGLTVYVYSLFAIEFELDFGAGRAVIMTGLTAFMVAQGMMAPKLGELLDRYSARRIMLLSSVSLALGFALISFSISFLPVIAIYATLISIGATVLTVLAPPVLLARWFVRYRGLAIGTAALGTQLGGFLLPPLLAFGIEVLDWREVMRLMALSTLLILSPLIHFGVIDKPAEVNQKPDGDGALSEVGPSMVRHSREIPVESLRAVIKKREFWIVLFVLVSMMAMFSSILSNLALFAHDVGASREAAALLISVFSLVGIVASPLVGLLCDRLDIRMVQVVILAVNIAGLMAFSFADTYGALVVGTCLVAIGAGGLTPFWGACVGRLVPITVFSRAMGLMGFFAIPVAASAPFLAGWLFDVSGSYVWLFISLLILKLAAVAMTFQMRSEARIG